MFESYTIKKLQAEINRFPVTTWTETVPLRIDGVVDQHTAFRALILAEEAYIAGGDQERAKMVHEIRDKTPAIQFVQSNAGQLTAIVAVLAAARQMPPAPFVFPTQQVLLFGGVGLGIGLIFWAVGSRKQHALPAMAGYEEDDDEDVIDAEYEEID